MEADFFTPLKQSAIAEQQVYQSKDSSLLLSLMKQPTSAFAISFLAFLLLGAIVVPWISQHTYFTTNLSEKNLAPSWDYLFGTDELGRDMFVRTWYGARISLSVGLAAATIDLILGVIWGGIAAMAGGRKDEVMMRIADILYAIPYLLKVILFMVVLGSGIFTIILAMTITGWINMARIVRGEILRLKELEFCQAALCLGASRMRVLFLHLLPNAFNVIIVTVTLTVPTAIFTEAFLSFLGLGVQAPIASWGTMASDGLPAMKYYPWRLFFPAFFISCTMLSFNLLGDALRDLLDPKLHRQ